MAWKSIGECLEAALIDRLECAERSGGTDALANEKGPEAVTPPASQQGRNVKHRKPRVLPDMSREIAVATPAPRRASPNAAAAISLVIDNTVGGSARMGGGERPSRLRMGREGTARCDLKLVM